MSRTDETMPLACDPLGIPAAERPAHFALARRLFGEEARERREWRGGYAIRFDAEALEDVARFVVNERRCCPFLDFELAVAAAAGPVWLRITGPAGTRPFLDAEGIGAG
jgi:hypothetical protein